jgi:hypothetical protein
LPVYRPRTRLVNFRLSEEEFQVLKETCARSGARSVSDYARSAVLTGRPAEGASELVPVGQSPCADHWDRLEKFIRDLDSRLRQLTQKEAVVSNG